MMPPEIMAAIIGAISGVISSLITQFVSLGKFRAEINKLRAETEGMLRELDEQRKHKFRKVRDCLSAFEVCQPEDPIGMFIAMQQLRESLENGIYFARENRELFRELIKVLNEVETQTRCSYPTVIQLANEGGDVIQKASPYDEQRRKIAEDQLGWEYARIVQLLRDARRQVSPSIGELRKALHEGAGLGIPITPSNHSRSLLQSIRWFVRYRKKNRQR